MKTRIHVNQHVIKANRKNGRLDPPLTAKNYKNNTCGHRVDVVDEGGRVVCSVVYSPTKPLSCGAHVWLETQLEIRVGGMDSLL